MISWSLIGAYYVTCNCQYHWRYSACSFSQQSYPWSSLLALVLFLEHVSYMLQFPLFLFYVFPRLLLAKQGDLWCLMLKYRLLVVGELVHELLGQLSYLHLSVSVSGFPVMLLKYLWAGSLSVVVGIAHSRLALLILDFYEPPMLLAKKL